MNLEETLRFIFNLESPSFGVRTFTCQDGKIDKAQNGFITSPKYPFYTLGENCKLDIVPADGFGYRFYMIDLALSPRFLEHVSNIQVFRDDKISIFFISCYQDLLMIDQEILCESERARYLYKSTGQSTLQYKTLEKLNDSVETLDSLRGFKIYFEAYSLADDTSTRPTFTNRPTPAFTKG
jgi:hypothetical protein